MATLCEFGTVPQQKKDGFTMVGAIKSTKEGILDTYQNQDIRLVPGAIYTDGKSYEFAIMRKDVA